MLQKTRPNLLSMLLTTGIACIASACATSTLEQPSGEQVFATHCASCHGATGEGNGPVAPIFNLAVPNLRALDQRYDGHFPADEVARYIDGRDLPDAHGARQMPVWGDVFEATESIVPGAADPATRIAALVEHLRSIQYP
jgi:mono/diheme cytochrome c family protein